MKNRFLLMASIAVMAVMLTACPPALELTFDHGEYSDEALDSNVGGPNYLEAADDFVLAAGLNTISRIEWWGTQQDDYTGPDDFTIRFYLLSPPGFPSNPPLFIIPVGNVNRQETGVEFKSKPIYRYWVDLSPFEMKPGETYFLSIRQGFSNWWWMKSPSDDPSQRCFFVSPFSLTWMADSENMSFRFWQ